MNLDINYYGNHLGSRGFVVNLRAQKQNEFLELHTDNSSRSGMHVIVRVYISETMFISQVSNLVFVNNYIVAYVMEFIIEKSEEVAFEEIYQKLQF